MHSANSIAATAAADRKEGTKRVLYADDMRELRDLITIVLQRDGHHVETVEDGEAARERLAADPAAFDLLITDHFMPRLTGLELVQQLPALGFRGKVMVFSSELCGRVKDEYLAAGADLVLPKPIFPHVLRESVHLLFLPPGRLTPAA